MPITLNKQLGILCSLLLKKEVTAKKAEGTKGVFSWLWCCKRLGFTETDKTLGIAKDLDKTSFVRSWLSILRKKKKKSNRKNPLSVLGDDKIVDGVQGNVREEAMARQISTVPETGSLTMVPVTHLGSHQTSIDGFVKSRSRGMCSLIPELSQEGNRPQKVNKIHGMSR